SYQQIVAARTTTKNAYHGVSTSGGKYGAKRVSTNVPKAKGGQGHTATITGAQGGTLTSTNSKGESGTHTVTTASGATKTETNQQMMQKRIGQRIGGKAGLLGGSNIGIGDFSAQKNKGTTTVPTPILVPPLTQ
ncbi:MAG: hypothetical protein JO129_02750, partial [Candidatus Dependentiae bacterium]|nr:hypothetical protein [Candidatus Dependentiae bacterium]